MWEWRGNQVPFFKVQLRSTIVLATESRSLGKNWAHFCVDGGVKIFVMRRFSSTWLTRGNVT